MYAADIDGARHTFQASGSLWQDALVMQDIETKTLWSQVSGRAIQGELSGKELTLFPSTITTYAEYKRLFPKGKLLAKPSKFANGSHYEDYFSDSTRLGIFGRADNFHRLPGKTGVIGLRLPDMEVAVTMSKLSEKRILRIDRAEPNVIVLYDRSTTTAFAFVLTDKLSSKSAEMQVTDTLITIGDATFDLRTGASMDNHSASLKPLPVITAYWFAWASFFPDSDLIE